MESKQFQRVKKDILIPEVKPVFPSLFKPMEVTYFKDSVGLGLALDLSASASVPLKPLRLSSSPSFDKGFDSLFKNFREPFVPLDGDSLDCFTYAPDLNLGVSGFVSPIKVSPPKGNVYFLCSFSK